MRLSLRFIIPLAIMLAAIAYGLVPLVDRLTLTWWNHDIEIRSKLIATTLDESLVVLLAGEAPQKKITALFEKAMRDERLYGIGYCDPSGTMLVRTKNFPVEVECPAEAATAVDRSFILDLPKGPLHVAFVNLAQPDASVLTLAIVHDMSFVIRRSEVTKTYILSFFALLALIISLLTVLIAHLSWKGWMKGIQSLLKGEGILFPAASPPEFQPFVKDLRVLVRDLENDRIARDTSQITWNPQALRDLLRQKLFGDEVLIVSNREPYIHNRKGDTIEVQVPASGLVTALEPIMRACSGTWIAHGSGTADRDVTDKWGHVSVPPEKPAYQIRRVWLTPEEEAGYYYGFSNEGLWPLCHIAHTRPIFRSEDWQQYVAVNQKFCDAVIEEAKTEDPVVLVQDYHLALVPRMIRKVLPRATIITFWHIPWPNPEAFGICPWRDEILKGLLGSTILGFHTRFHSNNFIDTVDRFLESRIDRETSTISYGGKLTAVNQYPISIEWPVRWLESQKSIPECRAEIRARNGLPEHVRIGIGVDRLDYTKGILERFRAIERLLERRHEWVGNFAFIQIAAPSRSSIPHYQSFDAEVRALAAHINSRFGTSTVQPIILKIEHHEPAQVFTYFRGSDLCMVTSLHDGMNLVAKEFIAGRDDEQGVVILSQFTGAARELPESLIVNPYDIDQCARAIQTALEMSPDEQRDRMRSMRGLIKQFNVFRWAGRMLIDAAQIRQRNRLLVRVAEDDTTFERSALL